MAQEACTVTGPEVEGHGARDKPRGGPGGGGPKRLYSGFRSHALSPLSTLLLGFGAEAAVEVGEAAAVLDAVVGQGEGFPLLSGLQV